MSITDIISHIKGGKGSAKSHMKNLIEMAAADGNLESEELRMLEYAALRNNISKERLREIQQDKSKVSFQAPSSNQEKFDQLYDLVQMMSVDDNVNPEELRLCEIFAIKFGFRKEVVREMIEMIREHIANWVGHKESMKEVTSKLQVFD